MSFNCHTSTTFTHMYGSEYRCTSIAELSHRQFQLGTRKLTKEDLLTSRCQRSIIYDHPELRTAHNSTQRISNDYTMTNAASNMLISYFLLSLFAAMNGRAVTTLAAVSAQCEADADLLRNNTALLAATPTGSCNIDLSSASFCTFDFATISADFERVCSEEGGQFQVQDVTWDCNVTLSGKKYNADYFFLNYPACVGASCNASEVEDSFENEVFPAFEQVLATQGFQCQVAFAVPVPSPVPIPAPVPVSMLSPVPIPAPVPVSVPFPVPIPAPVPVYVPFPLPIPAPVPVPVQSPVPIPAPVPVYVPFPLPIPAPVPASVPFPVPAPAPVPVSVPVSAAYPMGFARGVRFAVVFVSTTMVAVISFM
jgi:hypothetical protein